MRVSRLIFLQLLKIFSVEKAKQKKQYTNVLLILLDGASDENRTRVSTLARSCSTTELRQHLFSALKSYHLMQNYSRTSLKILKESYHK